MPFSISDLLSNAEPSDILTVVPCGESKGRNVGTASGNLGRHIDTKAPRCDLPRGAYHHHELV